MSFNLLSKYKVENSICSLRKIFNRIIFEENCLKIVIELHNGIAKGSFSKKELNVFNKSHYSS